MPSHWTYEKYKPDPAVDLFQGDIIDRTEPLLEVLGLYHSYFCDEKYLGFIVASQTCDMVMRGGECKANYINLAVIRSLESLMPSLLEEYCGTPIAGIYYSDSKGQIKQLIERIINQNEQASGFFYLEPDADVKIVVPSVALLRVSIALRSKNHYKIIQDARTGRLDSSFRSKLGWLAGNLYSRVDTPDWPEKIGKAAARGKVDRIINDFDEASKSVWLPRAVINRGLSKDPSIGHLDKDKAKEAFKAHEPKAPADIIKERAAELFLPLLDEVTPSNIEAAADRIKESASHVALLAKAISDALAEILDAPACLALAAKLSADGQLLRAMGDSMRKFARGFIGGLDGRPKDHSTLAAMLAERPLFDDAALAVARRLVEAEVIPPEQAAAAEAALKGLPTDAAIVDCIVLLVRDDSRASLGRKLAARLAGDAEFRVILAPPA